MSKVRKGRLAGVVLVLGAVAWGVASFTADDESVETAAARPVDSDSEPERETQTETPAPTQVANEPTRSRAQAAAALWGQRTTQLASLLEEFPWLTVHRMKAYDNGTLRLECSSPGGNLREVARFRDTLKDSALGSGSTLQGRPVHITWHGGGCDLHGDVSEIMIFNIDLAPPEPLLPDSVEPGSLALVAHCSATD